MTHEDVLSLVSEKEHKMTTRDERMQILQMVGSGQISAEEGARLLEALEAKSEEDRRPRRKARWLRVRVTDLETGRHKVNINLPMGLMDIGAKIGAKFAAPADFDLEELVESIRGGAEGKIIDVEDREDNERVEIYVE